MNLEPCIAEQATNYRCLRRERATQNTLEHGKLKVAKCILNCIWWDLLITALSFSIAVSLMLFGMDWCLGLIKDLLSDCIDAPGH